MIVGGDSTSIHTNTDRASMRVGISFFLCLSVAVTSFSQDALPTLNDAREAFLKGDYDRCIELSQSQFDRKVWNEQWPIQLLQSQLVRGQYPAAFANWQKAVEQFPASLRIRLLGIQICRFTNQPSKAKEQIELIDDMLVRMPVRFTGSNDLVPLGEYFLMAGEDPKQVLKSCFDQALKLNPTMTEAHIATARMAIDKNDAKVASQSIAKALKQEQGNPEIYYLDALAWQSTDPQRASESLSKAMDLNPNFVPGLLYLCEARMNEERYESAQEILKGVESINPNHPKLWALRAAIAHLEGRYQDEGQHRSKALEPWSLNPEVDHTIGKHLALHYRFAESIEYQLRAIKMDGGYIPALTQLAQDQLRRGQTEEGWKAVDFVRKKDPYDVTIYNLKQLQQRIDSLATLTIPGFVVRMDHSESRIYGQEVLGLLTQARDTLTKKYQTVLDEPIYVEIFPRQKDFAIRTFGLPGGEGFLGVCFGRLITANSPAAMQANVNWQAVLWHEYCHVVTLHKTKNKMPRWLSEGLSVYEEKLQDKTWGQAMDPTYREMILDPDDFVPASKLSGAFLRPKTPMHLQFAYYESALAVEYLIETYGMGAMIRLLDDLALGIPANDALTKMVGSLDSLDDQFEAYAQGKASQFGPDVDWAKPPSRRERDGVDPLEMANAIAKWRETHPESYWLTLEKCRTAMKNNDWDQVITLAEQLQKAWPEDNKETGCYAMLAKAYQGLGMTDKERSSLQSLVERSSDAYDSISRLIALCEDQQDWGAVAEYTERLHAIQPLRIDVQEKRAKANERMGRFSVAANAWRACLELDPLDPGLVHFKVADNLAKLGDQDKAKRHVLMALEESPRFEDALLLLIQLRSSDKELDRKSEESHVSEPLFK